jgi:sugar phosphate isomerase/epimerase
MFMKRNLSVLKIQGFSDLFEMAGDYDKGEESFSAEGLNYVYRSESIQLTAKIEEEQRGVYFRRDTAANLSDSPVTIRSFRSKFVLPDGDYEVYSQYNLWQKESVGGWQPLVTGVFSKVESLRTAAGAVPVIAIRNRQNRRGIVFHLLPEYSWIMSVQRCDLRGGKSQIEISMGPYAKNFALTLNSGESLELSKIIYYEFENERDLDGHKLHGYMNRTAPRSCMPVIYNTWLSTFDRFTYDSLLEQANLASQIGAEYFVVDAGWFGEEGNWWGTVGDWKENFEGAFAGRMKEFSDKVRDLGMKFGLWFEIERASPSSESVKSRPDFYFMRDGWYFVNFANPEAVEYILDLLEDRIRRYSIEFIKFDFNADVFDDPDSEAFIRYYKGYVQFIRRLKKRHPDLYLCNCASGGMRMQLANGFLFDSFWLSDNQCAYEGIRIYKDTLLRMPFQWIEKWAVIRSLQDFSPVYGGGSAEKILTTHDAIWDRLGSVRRSWLKGFLTASPLGISCDLTKLSPDTLDFLKEHIQNFKKDRDFYIRAECRILSDTKALTAFEYSLSDKGELKILAFVKEATQQYAVLYPSVDSGKTYLINGEKVEGKDLDRYGIKIDTNECWKCERVDLHAL